MRIIIEDGVAVDMTREIEVLKSKLVAANALRLESKLLKF